MTPRSLLPRATALVLLILIAGCGGPAVPDDEDTAPADQAVEVSVVRPSRQTFHDTVQAWGSAEPLYPIVVNLPHGGQVADLNVTPGQAVKRGQRLLTVRPDPATRSAFEQAQTAADLARSDYRRVQQLAAQRLATQSQLAGARKAQADAAAALEAQRALGGGAASEEVDAPLDGVVSAVDISLGERFAANAPLLRFTPANTLQAELGVAPQDGRQLRVGMAVRLHDVYGAGEDLPAHLSMVGKVVDPHSHLLPVLAQIPATTHPPIAGTALAATIRSADYSAWAVPRAAVLHDAKGDYLFVADHGKARRVAVTLRQPAGDPVGVQGPLDAQSQVIVLGVYELEDGAAVTVHPPAAATPVQRP